MGIRLSRRLAFMKGMNEKQLLDFGKSLIPLGDSPRCINHTRQTLFRDHTAVYAKSWAHQSKLCLKRNIAYPLHQLLPSHLSRSFTLTGGHLGSFTWTWMHLILTEAYADLNLLLVCFIKHSCGNGKMELPQVSLWLLQLLTRHQCPTVRTVWWPDV